MAVLLPNRPVLRYALRPILAFLTVAVVGITGFLTLVEISLVDAMFWLFNPTSMDLYFQTNDGPEQMTKAFALGVRVGLVSTGIWIGQTAVSAAFAGQVTEELRRMNTKRKIDALSGHVIICGYGMFGQTVAAQLRKTGHDVVVIEHDPAEFESIDEDVLAIQGDARKDSVLTEANVASADVVVGAIDDSNVNIQTAITAGQLAPDLRVVVRVGDEMYESVARRAGADEVVIPEVVSGETVSDWL